MLALPLGSQIGAVPPHFKRRTGEGARNYADICEIPVKMHAILPAGTWRKESVCGTIKDGVA